MAGQGIRRREHDPKKFVTNKFGQAYDVQNLYACDAIVFLNCTDKTTTISILAFTLRACEHVIENFRRGDHRSAWRREPDMTFSVRSTGAKGTIFIRIAVGLNFFTQGVLKYTDPHMGVDRFTRIGFPHPAFTAHLVGAFEIGCGLLVLFGITVRMAAVPLLIIICTALVTTKIPELSHPGQGFWFMVSDARIDFAMLMCLLFLLVSGGGSSSVSSGR